MGRLGVAPEDLPGVVSALKSSPHLLLEGLSTHLASSEILDAPSVGEQLRSFEEAKGVLRNAGLEPALVHVANTGAVISRRETWHSPVSRCTATTCPLSGQGERSAAASCAWR